MGARMQAHDWAATPFGPLEGWPQSLRSAVSICLGCGFPIAIYWGRDLALAYNHAWSPIPGDKHPWALGRPGREVWPEIRQDIAPLFSQFSRTGEAVRPRDQLLAMWRRGFIEECYFDFTFSPIRNEAGTVRGIFNAAIETTPRVLGERRLKLLRVLAAACVDAASVEEACASAVQVLGSARHDVPFALLYLMKENSAHLAAVAGLAAGDEAAPQEIILGRGGSWPLDPAGAVLVEDVTRIFSTPLSSGPWPEPVRRALILPLVRDGQQSPAGFVVLGLSPRLLFDAEYESTLGLVADTIARAMERARAADAERQRAEQLAALDRAKTAFFSNVSHELRTPLTLLLAPVQDALATDTSFQPPIASGSTLPSATACACKSW